MGPTSLFEIKQGSRYRKFTVVCKNNWGPPSLLDITQVVSMLEISGFHCITDTERIESFTAKWRKCIFASPKDHVTCLLNYPDAETVTLTTLYLGTTRDVKTITPDKPIDVDNMESNYYRLRRSFSCELPVIALSSTGAKTDVWYTYVNKSLAEVTKLQALLAENKSKIEKSRTNETELRAKCLDDIEKYKVKLEKKTVNERGTYEKEIKTAEENENKLMDRFLECMKDLKEMREVVSSLKAKYLKGAEPGMDGKSVESCGDGRNERGEGSDNVSKEESKSRKGKATEGQKVVMMGDSDSDDVQREADENDDHEKNAGSGCFSFLRRLFSCCCKWKRSRGKRYASTDADT